MDGIQSWLRLPKSLGPSPKEACWLPSVQGKPGTRIKGWLSVFQSRSGRPALLGGMCKGQGALGVHHLWLVATGQRCRCR